MIKRIGYAVACSVGEGVAAMISRDAMLGCFGRVMGAASSLVALLQFELQHAPRSGLAGHVAWAATSCGATSKVATVATERTENDTVDCHVTRVVMLKDPS
jgi:hypothetical protein